MFLYPLLHLHLRHQHSIHMHIHFEIHTMNLDLKTFSYCLDCTEFLHTSVCIGMHAISAFAKATLWHNRKEKVFFKNTILTLSEHNNFLIFSFVFFFRFATFVFICLSMCCTIATTLADQRYVLEHIMCERFALHTLFGVPKS